MRCKVKSSRQIAKDKLEKVRLRRLEDSYRRKEKVEDAEAHKRRRLNPEVHSSEKKKNAEAMKKVREDPLVRAAERQRDAEARKEVREDPVVRVAERQRNAEAMKEVRENPLVRAAERQRDAEARKEVREDPVVRAAERQRNAEAMKEVRENPVVRAAERQRDAEARSNVRDDPEIRASERGKDGKARKFCRNNPIIRHKEALQKRVARNGTLDENIEEFLLKTLEGPTYICACCGSLWFKSSTVSVGKKQLELYDDEFVQKVFFLKDRIQCEIPVLCSTCNKDFRSKKIPRLALCNGLDFPVVPEVLQDLTTLEERMVALRLLFMRICSLGGERQCGVKGNVVHIENDLDLSVAVLPRSLDQTLIVPVELYRHLDHPRPYITDNLRIAKVHLAADYLVKTYLYKKEGVALSVDWLEKIQAEINSHKTNQETLLDPPNRANTTNNDDQEFREVNPGSSETMMLKPQPDMIRIAPGQGKIPMSLLMDLDAEAAAYPTIYCGERRVIPDNMSPMDLWKSETRRYDRRCAEPRKVLHAFKLSQNYQVSRQITICLRKKKGKKVTVGELLNEANLEHIITHDHGFRILKDVRTSPAYWEAKGKHVYAMIRQLGIPTLFITLSAAETRWGELLVILTEVLDTRTISLTEAEELSYEKKADLIRRDPVTCSRYFDYRLRCVFNLLFKRQNGIFAPYRLKDFFWRIEFQHRGSPHAHMLIWLEGAPQFEVENPRNEKDCIKFIEDLICCQSSEDGVIHQQHRHTKTCKRSTKDGNICRFQIPYPPMRETKIILPLPTGFPADIRKAMKAKLSSVKAYLEETKQAPEDISFETFLLKMGLEYKDYLFALRCSVKRPTIFLKRKIDSCFTNAYIKSLAKCWKANMDVQYILDPFGCAQYVCSYITKSCGGVSKLLQATADQIKNGNFNLKERMRKFGNVFLNGVEVSAQEACYGVLQMPLTNSSRDIIFIPTGPPEERVMFIKSKEALMQLEEDSTDIAASGLLEHYKLRPSVLETMCLAEFASEYTYSRRKPGKNSVCDSLLDVHDSMHAEEESAETELPQVLALMKHTGFIRKRRIGRVIRFRRYGEKDDPDNYCREQLMLFTHWREETSELIDIDHKRRYAAMESEIKLHRLQFNTLNEDIDQLVVEEDEPDEENVEIDEQYAVMQGIGLQSDIIGDGFCERERPKVERFPIPSLVSGERYKELVERLNHRQEQYLCHVVDNIKEGNRITDYVYGGAGVGKSALIECIVQAVLRLTLQKQGSDIRSCKVLLAAPTGQAAFNIKGTTLHNAFLLPLNQFKGSLPKLSDDFANTLSYQLKECKLVIIDEISMVSCDQLYHVSSRLQQIFKDRRSFGGKSVILFGDLRQLRPVGAYPIYSNVKGDLGEIVGNPLWEDFTSYELTEIMRQKDDKRFAEALNNLAIGCMSAEDIALFKSREVTAVGYPADHCLRLFKDNKSVTEYNERVLDAIKEESVVAKAVDTCQGNGSKELKEALIAKVQTFPTAQTMGLQLYTRLVVTARYMVTLNIDVPDGLVNGSLGILRKITYGTTGEGKKMPLVAWMRFSPEEVGINRRKLHKVLCSRENGTDSLTPVMIEKRIIHTWPNSNTQCLRRQFPLVAAEAMTIHKSQGSLHDQIVINVSKGLVKSALYVACSRARTLSGLFIEGTFQPPKFDVNDKTELEIQRIKLRPVPIADYKNPKTYVLLNTQIVYKVSETPKSPLQLQLLDGFYERKASNSLIVKKRPTRLPTAGSSVVVRKVGRFQVSMNDIDTLNPSEWLSDAVVDTYLETLCADQNGVRCHNFGSFFYRYLLDDNNTIIPERWRVDTEATILLVPVIRNSHWTMLVADRRLKNILMLDSNSSSVSRDSDICSKFWEFLNFIDAALQRDTEWTKEVAVKECPQQTNGNDCGVFVCRFAYCKSQDHEFNFDQSSMNMFRLFIKAALLG